MKRIISFVLTLAMLMTLTVPAALAADVVAVSAANAEVMEGGKTVSSKLSLTSNPGGLAAVSVIVFWKADAGVDSVDVAVDPAVFDEENTSVSAVVAGNNKNVKNELAAFGANTADYKACTVDFMVADATVDTDAVLGTLAFTFADATVKGQKFEYSVAVTYACDAEDNDVEFSEDKVDATVTILEDPNLGKYKTPTLFVVPEMTEITEAGGKLKIDVRIDANPGFWGGYYAMVYPASWTVDSFAAGSLFAEKNIEFGEPDMNVAENAGFLTDRLKSYPETPVAGTSFVGAFFGSEGEYEVNDGNGVLVSYVFNVPSDMQIGDKADFSIIYDREGDFIINYEEGDTTEWVVFDAVGATVEMIEFKCDHVWDDGVVTTESTCYSEGVKTFTCTLCGATYTEAVAMTEHNLVDVETEATCTEPKSSYKKCTNDGCTYQTEAQTEGEALGHDWALVKTVVATCKEGGYELYKCARCEVTEKRNETAETPHTPGEPQTQDATCTEDGHTVTVCTECGEVINDVVIPAKGHSFVADDSQSKPATCTEDGYTVEVCSVCGEIKSTPVAKLGHAFGEFVVTTPATCTAAGVKTATCSRCDVTKTESITALGHDFGEYQETKAATCTEKGEETRYCSRCDAKESVATDALGHTWDEGAVETEPTCTEAGVKVYTCSACGETKTEELAALGHTWDEGTVTKEATETETGVMTYTCTVCGETKEEEIPVVEPEKKPEDDDNKKEEKKEEEKKEESPKTGDNMVYIIIALAVVILASAAVIVIRRRKEND